MDFTTTASSMAWHGSRAIWPAAEALHRACLISCHYQRRASMLATKANISSLSRIMMRSRRRGRADVVEMLLQIIVNSRDMMESLKAAAAAAFGQICCPSHHKASDHLLEEQGGHCWRRVHRRHGRFGARGGHAIEDFAASIRAAADTHCSRA